MKKNSEWKKGRKKMKIEERKRKNEKEQKKKYENERKKERILNKEK